MSANPISIASDAAPASGTRISSRNGTKGAPSQANNGVCSAMITAIVPTAMITGITPIHISSTFETPSATTFGKRAAAPRATALRQASRRSDGSAPLATASGLAACVTGWSFGSTMISSAYSSGIDASGGIRGRITAVTSPAMLKVR